MKDAAEFGLNKTPAQLHPVMTQAMLEGCEEFPPHAEDMACDAFTLRKSYIQHSEQLGAVPLPSTLRGAVSTGVLAIQGNSPSVLIDKLGERMAFERSGIRLYDALITKCKSAQPVLDIETLEQFRNDEAEHFSLVRDCIASMGGDPTAQTPCADSAGMAAMGLMQVLNDPRSSIPQCVEAILMAELADFAAWELLIELADESGLSDYIDKFQQARMTENHHMHVMKKWLEQMTLNNQVEALG
ncbi:ferritin-like domain-containing protein [Candidatus Methylobacter oryzae]|uniref:Ferritin-like domain-containing protein n=1 Tax=Candidatus Methylobacter oryzae TaxID=2497749 RepID=A0ABY3CGE6_9GAMM|nr:ferritin-like domain-containing protein [Candidatus Methylobacter oryzae]TRX02910.1 ferritin-like domain-containing protein [Candidatus Methylobacter oryzae]